MDRALAPIPILFEDEYLIIADKPAGMLSEDHESLPSLPAALRRQCGCGVYPVHRLDRTTRGLIVYAKTKETAAALSMMIQKNEAEKIYLAAVEGTPDPSGEMTDLLYFDRTRNKSYVVTRDRRGVKEARLTYERLMTAEKDGITISLVKIRLLTGRTHQIRVQFASRGMPLLGDRRYGSHAASKEIALCCAELHFRHPMTGESCDCRCMTGEEWMTAF